MLIPEVIEQDLVCELDVALMEHELEAIRKAFARVQSATAKRCAEIAENERVDFAATKDETDRAYNLATEHIAEAIRKEFQEKPE